MSAKMRRRRRHDRRKRILTQRAEDRTFFATGRFPASATSFATCFCGTRAFTRGDDSRFREEFHDQHSFCDAYDDVDEAVAS